MANDLTLPVRRAALAALKNDADLIELVPGAQVHPQTTPPKPIFPFIRMGSPSGTGVRAACVDGNEGIFSVHGFAKPRKTGEQTVETAEDYASRIGAGIAAALGDRRIELESGRSARIRWTGHQLIPDPEEADCFHTVQNFAYRVLA